ncbi:hypothetical protein BELL_0571g00020 [Botrytis elliptica]|uniref:Thioesterase domain-containing protein n=1 Tax=Botrytis elliptica TaxID=278938 RepID=A0A4Z1JCQ2_9HELO|nr:hypothetical protein BELL_0571g00020 [Botrytis elliptica]
MEIAPLSTLDTIAVHILSATEAQDEVYEAATKIDISTGDFERLTDVASLHDLLSSRVDGKIADTSSNNIEKQGPVSILEIEINTNSDWNKTIFRDSDKLNEAFILDIQTTEFTSIVEVASIFTLIPGASDVDLVQTPITSPLKSLPASSDSSGDGAAAFYTEINLTENKEGTTSTKYTAASVHAAFQNIRHSFDIHAKTTNYFGYWDKVYPEQLKTVTAFIIEGFEKLGCPIRRFRQGEKLPAVKLTLGKYRREILRLWDILEEADVVKKIGDEVVCGPAAKDYDNKAMSAKGLSTKLIADFPYYLPMNRIIGLAGPQLADCFTSDVNPISFLYGNEKGRRLVYEFNFSTPDALAAVNVLCDFVSAIIRCRSFEHEPLHILELLCPNVACVVLLEGTQKLAWLDLVWGLLDGWWLFDDGLRYAMQSVWAWERDMQAAGFSHVDWSDGISRESRGFRVICGMLTDTEDPCPAKATSMLLFGSGALFRGLKPSLVAVENVSVYALDIPFTIIKPDPRQPPTLEELAAIYVAEIKQKQPEGHNLIGRYSIGGVVAYEIVRQLVEDDNEVEKLFIIDTACPTFSTSLPKALVDFLDSIMEVRATNSEEIQEKRRGKNDHSTLANQQLSRYQVSKLPGRKIPSAMLFLAREGLDTQNKIPRPDVLPEEQRIVSWFLDDRLGEGSLGWEELLQDVRVIPAEGNHFSMMGRSMISN